MNSVSGGNRERSFCLRQQKSTADNGSSVSHGERVGVSYLPSTAIFSEGENPPIKEGVTNKGPQGISQPPRPSTPRF